MSISKWIAIINPNAGKGAAVKKWPVISNILKKNKIAFETMFTAHRHHAEGLVADALKSGFRNIISVGGDGTLHEVVNGIFYQTEVPADEVTVAVIPVGSGNDWAKLYGVPLDCEGAVEVLAGGKTFLQDLGKVTYMEAGGENVRYMVNVAGVGFDANICYYTNRFKLNGRGGKGAYVKAAFKALAGRRFNFTEIRADDNVFFSGKMFSVGLGIGKYSGGGMLQVPDAIPDDGLINIMAARKLPKLKFIMKIKTLFAGTIYKIKQVSHTIARKYEIRTGKPDRVEIDGEVVGTTPMSVEVVPRALRVIVGGSIGENVV